MNETHKWLANAVLSKLDSLSLLRTFLLTELNFVYSPIPKYSSERIHSVVASIDELSLEFPAFLASFKRINDPVELESAFDDLSLRHERFMKDLEIMFVQS